VQRCTASHNPHARELIPERGEPETRVNETARESRPGPLMDMHGPRPGRDRQTAVSIAALVIAVGGMLLLTYLSLNTLSAARAFIQGESQWSKAQKTAVASLTRYVRTRNEDDFDNFQKALRAPLAFRVAREELDHPRPDMNVVRRSFMEGGIHPDDIGRMAAFHQRFRNVSDVHRSIGIWAAGDSLIAELLSRGARIQALTTSGAADEAALSAVLEEVHGIDAELTRLETAFGRVMGDAARMAHRVLFASAGAAALLLVIVSVLVMHRAARAKRASAETVRQSEEKKRTVLETIEDGYYEMDLDGIITLANPGLHRIFGRAPEDVIGRHVRDVIDPVSTPRLLDALSSVRRTGTPVRSITASLLRADGSRRTVEGSATLLRTREGQPAGFCGVVRDVTEQLQREEALRRSEAEYRAVVQHARYGIYRSTPDGRLLAVNPALVEMLGYESEAALLAVPLSEAVYAHAEHRDMLIRRHGHSDTVSDVEVEWKRRDGSPILVRLNGRRIRDQDGFTGFEMFVEDLTHRRALELQLRQAQKMQAVGQLTGGIAHDFNNLLTIIASTADLLAEDLPSENDRAAADLDELRGAARRGADMVRKLLAFSRRGYLEFTYVDLADIVRESTTMLRRILPAHIRIELSADTPCPVRADRGAIEQILLNLATNARDAMPHGGVLHLRTCETYLDDSYCTARGGGEPGSFATLVVADTGSGMDAATRERAFEPFFTTKAPGAGTGLGMAMVYGIIRQHGGFVDLESEPGAGTTIRIHVPLAAAAATAESPLGAAERPGGRETILLVEDEPAILGTGRRILERHGYTVLVAQDGLEALSIVRQRRDELDLILSDVVMPNMGGRALFEAVLATGVPIRFLFTSGYTEREVDGMLDPGLPLVAKPWSIDVLLRRVRDVLDGPVETLQPLQPAER
jgi:two-component system, cell cycle sensor histidine kinase and response regulator CckA